MLKGTDDCSSKADIRGHHLAGRALDSGLAHGDEAKMVAVLEDFG
jgi:hypothetical protein